MNKNKDENRMKNFFNAFIYTESMLVTFKMKEEKWNESVGHLSSASTSESMKIEGKAKQTRKKRALGQSTKFYFVNDLFISKWIQNESTDEYISCSLNESFHSFERSIFCSYWNFIFHCFDQMNKIAFQTNHLMIATPISFHYCSNNRNIL